MILVLELIDGYSKISKRKGEKLMHLVNNIDCIPNWVTECYALCLNRMRGKAEEVDAVIFSDCREDLINYIKQEKAEEP